MKKKRVGTITLAIGLIMLGVVLFINNYTSFGLEELYKYWPVLLIGLGIEMFVYMIIYRQDEDVKLRVDGLCIVFIIVAALFASNISFKLSPDFSFNIFGGNSIIDGVRYKSELKENITKDSISKDYTINKLEVKNSYGDIKLVPYNEKYIKVEALVKVRYNDEQAAREYLNNAVKIIEGETTQISVEENNRANKDAYSKATIDFVIYVPDGVYADVSGSFGDIQVQGLSKDLDVSNQYGDIDIKDIGGSAIVKNSFGKIEIINVGGKVEADNQNGEIKADSIKGDARIETSFGKIEAYNVKGSLNAKTSNGKLDIENISGNADLRSSFGDIDAANIDGNSIINNSNGSINVNELKGNVQIKNSFGRIRFSSSNSENADIYAKTSFGDIETSLPINVTKAVNQYTAQGITGEGKYKIELITSNGNIEIK